MRTNGSGLNAHDLFKKDERRPFKSPRIGFCCTVELRLGSNVKAVKDAPEAKNSKSPK